MFFERQDYQDHVGRVRLEAGKTDTLEALFSALPPRLNATDLRLSETDTGPRRAAEFNYRFRAWRKSECDIYRLVGLGLAKAELKTTAPPKLLSFSVEKLGQPPRFRPRDKDAFAARDALREKSPGPMWLTEQEVAYVKGSMTASDISALEKAADILYVYGVDWAAEQIEGAISDAT